MNRSKTTCDHDEIRRWAEARDGKPVAVKGTGRKNDVGIIRIDFPGYSGEGKLAPISWDEWFEKFDKSNLAMVLQEETAKGERSNFNKLVARESLDPDARGEGVHVNKARSRRARTASRRTSARSPRGTSPAKRSASATKRSASATRRSASATRRSASATGRSASATKRAGTARPRATARPAHRQERQRRRAAQ